MILTVKVKPGSSKKEVVEEGGDFTVYLKASPEKNKANKELIKLLAKYFRVSSSQVKILKGFTSKEKVIDINYMPPGEEREVY